MNKNLKLICAGLLAGLLSLPLMAENWFVCMGSYKVKNNANIFVNDLKIDGVDAFIYECEINGEKYYRVLFDEEFDVIQDARNKASEISESKAAVKNGLSGLWVCAAQKPESASVIESVKEIENQNEISTEFERSQIAYPDYTDAPVNIDDAEKKSEIRMLENKEVPDMLFEELAEPEEYEAFEFDAPDSDIE